MSNIVSGVIIGVLGFLLFRQCTKDPIIEVKEVTRIEYRDSVRVDTLRDTIFTPPIIELTELTDTLIFRDSIFVPVPISKYTFSDSTYAITMSGWSVEPLSIEVFPKTIYRTETIYKDTEVTVRKRFGLGATAGLTVLHTSEGLKSGIGATIGLTYNF